MSCPIEQLKKQFSSEVKRVPSITCLELEEVLRSQPVAARFYSELYAELMPSPRANASPLVDLGESGALKHESWFWALTGLSLPFLLITSGEGGGGYILDCASGLVFDIDFSDVSELNCDKRMPARWQSFEQFLRWYFELS